MASEPQTSRRPWRALLIEDNPGDVVLVREALSEHSVECALTVISDGENAIRFIEEIDAGPEGACPDLVILDLNLPRRSGNEVLQCIRASVKCVQIPVLVLSSSGAEKDRRDALKLGATRYVQKPSLLSEFLKLGELFKTMLESRLEN
jgi:DNA-binding response OmpR family regulator